MPVFDADADNDDGAWTPATIRRESARAPVDDDRVNQIVEAALRQEHWLGRERGMSVRPIDSLAFEDLARERGQLKKGEELIVVSKVHSPLGWYMARSFGDNNVGLEYLRVASRSDLILALALEVKRHRRALRRWERRCDLREIRRALANRANDGAGVGAQS